MTVSEVKRETAEENVNEQINVAIFLYDGVELLDFSGPAEVFAASTLKDKKGNYKKVFKVYTVAVSEEVVTSQGFLKIIPDYSISNAPLADIVVLAGGSTGKSRKTPEVLEWIKTHANKDKLILSVCTGAFLLGDAGLLKNKSATTWFGAIERFKKAFPETIVFENTRYVDNGNIITTAGVSAGIDGSLHLVGRLVSEECARSTAAYMEYDKWAPGEGKVILEQEE